MDYSFCIKKTSNILELLNHSFHFGAIFEKNVLYNLNKMNRNVHIKYIILQCVIFVNKRTSFWSVVCCKNSAIKNFEDRDIAKAEVIFNFSSLDNSYGAR